MTSYPSPLDSPCRDLFGECLPEVHILDRLVVGCSPTLPDPVGKPFGDAVDDVLGVSVDDQISRSVGIFKGFDRSGQLHAVVGRVSFATKVFGALAGVDNKYSPPTGAWIRFACTVGVGNYLAHHSFLFNLE